MTIKTISITESRWTEPFLDSRSQYSVISDFKIHVFYVLQLLKKVIDILIITNRYHNMLLLNNR